MKNRRVKFMAKLVELESQTVAKVGIPVPVTVNYNLDLLENEVNVTWAGLRLYLHRPCKKNILVSISEVFTKGRFENTRYKRTKNLQLSRRMIPTINGNDILYNVHGSLTFVSERGEEDNYHNEKIVILPTYKEKRTSKPIKIELQGIILSIAKDTYKEEEQVDLKSIDLPPNVSKVLLKMPIGPGPLVQMFKILKNTRVFKQKY